MPKQSGLAHLSRPADHHDRNALTSFLSLSVTPRLTYIPCSLMVLSSHCKVLSDEIQIGRRSSEKRFAAALTFRDGIRRASSRHCPEPWPGCPSLHFMCTRSAGFALEVQPQVTGQEARGENPRLAGLARGLLICQTAAGQ